MNVAVLIPARNSSKRLPGKNIKPLCGKPLLFWTIDTALEAGVFAQVCVSTESAEIQSLVRHAYSDSDVRLIDRPESLATDSADLNDVAKHFLEQDPGVEYLSLMMPTYPFRKVNRIREEILPCVLSRQVDRVVSVRPGSYSTFDYWSKEGDTFLRMFCHEPLWCGAGNAAYLMQKRSYFFTPVQKWPIQFGERTLRIQTDFEESVDIDTTEDFEVAQKIARGFYPIRKPLFVYDGGESVIVLPKGADGNSMLKHLRLKNVDLSKPVLIVKKADPQFTFLRWYEASTSHNYYSEKTEQILLNLPQAGHSQDIPEHYCQVPEYRVLRKHTDVDGVIDDTINAKQVLYLNDLQREWDGYVDPLHWDKRCTILKDPDSS